MRLHYNAKNARKRLAERELSGNHLDDGINGVC